MKKQLILIAIILSAFVISCSESYENDESGKLKVIATTMIIGDAVEYIAGDKIDFLSNLCGPGVDPHTYSATVRDIELMRKADIIFYNGLNLEDRLGEILEKMQEKSVAVAEAIPKDNLYYLENDSGVDEVDPHVWNDIILWQFAVKEIRDELKERDPDNSKYYDSTTAEYLIKLDELNRYALEQIEKIPKENRIIISSHDGFNYLARLYGFEARAVLGISTESEAGIKSMQELQQFIIDNDVEVAFLETMINSKGIEALKEAVNSKGKTLEISTEALFSDTFDGNPPYDTFLKSYKQNIDVITKNLSNR